MKLLNKKTLTGFAAMLAFAVVGFIAPVNVSAADCAEGTAGGATAGINCARGEGTPANLFEGEDSIFTTVVNILLFIIGAVSVVMLIYGGIRYTTSAGNAASVTAAKNTIMYAIIGLIIAFLAFAIVNWVLGSLPSA